jgi:ppGpp synthetase/RelA/SpoT-type nucleotidyltranferase
MAKDRFNLSAIAREYGINEEHINTVKDLEKVSVLKEIYDDFRGDYSEYMNEKDEIYRHIKDVLGVAHSMSNRIKDKKHLIAKIIRNGIIDDKDKYQGINADNYSSIITDLIGFRIIILAVEDWEKVHKFLMNKIVKDERYYLQENSYTRDIVPNDDRHYLIEKVQVHTVIGDDTYDESTYPELEVKGSMDGYRSIHYIVKHNNYRYEIQVRTIFEEGWLEFDHQIKYPNDKGNPIKGDFLAAMRSMAQASNKMASFYRKHENLFTNISDKQTDTPNIHEDINSIRTKTDFDQKSSSDAPLNSIQTYIKNL